MKLTPFQGPQWWRLALLCAFLFGLKNQLLSQNQNVSVNSVQNFGLYTRLYQWSFDVDSTGGPHGDFLQILDTAGGNDGPKTASGFDGSTGFSFSAYSSDPRAKLKFGPFDTRGMDSVRFEFHLAAPQGTFENDDFIGINISLDGGLTFYNQIKVKGSKNGTSAPGWDHGEGIHYKKDFRYSSRTSVIYGHVDPVSKDTVDGLGALTIDNIPATSGLYVVVELANSTHNGEVYNVDNFTLSAKLPAASSTLSNGVAYRIDSPLTSIALADTIQSLYVNLAPTDTFEIQGSPMVSGTIDIRSGYLKGDLTLLATEGATLKGEGHSGDLFIERTLLDSGYHFIGQPEYFSIVDTLSYAWVYNPTTGGWTSAQNALNFPDSGFSMARVVYLSASDVPLRLRRLSTFEHKWTQPVALQWADTCLDGETPFGGWNLVANVRPNNQQWDALLNNLGASDSLDATYYLWQDGQYASYNSFTGPVGAGPQIPAGSAFWVRLSNQKDPGVVLWSMQPRTNTVSAKNGGKSRLRPLYGSSSSGTDTVQFSFTTAARIGGGSYTASLYIDPVFSTSFMPCCDQIYLGSPLQTQVVVRKAKTSFAVANYPRSSYYPIMVVGEGTLTAKGAPGYFFVAPNIIPGHQNVVLRGKGPHKVYWLGADHPDGTGDSEYAEQLSVEELPSVPDHKTLKQAWDILGRPGGAEADFELQFIDGEWKKVVRVE